MDTTVLDSPTSPASTAEPVRIPRLLHALLCEGQRWPDSVARMVWGLWCQDTRYAAVVSGTHRMSQVVGLHDQGAKDRQLRHYLRDILSGQVLVLSLERLVERGSVGRVEANRLEDRLLACLDAKGRWIF